MVFLYGNLNINSIRIHQPMNILLSYLKRICTRKPTILLGRGKQSQRVIRRILACTKPDAIKARHHNYRRDIQRLLDCVKN